MSLKMKKEKLSYLHSLKQRRWQRWNGTRCLTKKRQTRLQLIRFLSRSLGTYPTPKVIAIDKLRSYPKHIKTICFKTDHRTHKRLNNWLENAHQFKCRKERCLMKFKSLLKVQRLLPLIGKVRNIFSIEADRYKKKTSKRRLAFSATEAIWLEIASFLLSA